MYCCTGQNSHLKTVLKVIASVQSDSIKVDSIELEFMVSGHIYLPNDAHLAVIEYQAKRTQNNFSPDNWLDLLRTCLLKIGKVLRTNRKYTTWNVENEMDKTRKVKAFQNSI